MECLDKQKSTLGADHPDTLGSINNLAGLYSKQGNYDDASEPLMAECLDKRKATLGADHPKTLGSVNNLAVVYESQGNYDAAEPLFMECAEKAKATSNSWTSPST